jgi:hypothetical protein
MHLIKAGLRVAMGVPPGRSFQAWHPSSDFSHRPGNANQWGEGWCEIGL